MIINNKRIAAFLRSDRFKETTIDSGYVDSFKIKPIRLKISKSTAGAGSTLGLSTTIGLSTTLGLGGITVTELINEDYT